MRIYAGTYRDKHGIKKTVKKYRIALRINKKLHRFVAFESKMACDLLLINIKQLQNLRDAGLEPSKKLQLWFSDLPISMQNKLVDLDLLDTKWSTSNKTLLKHVNDWERHLKAKGNTANYIRLCATRATQIIEDCGFNYWKDLSASTVENYVANIDLSKRTKNFYIKSIKQFCNWMLRYGRASSNPLKYLQTSQVLSEDMKHQRRILTPSELSRFLETTKEGPELYGMSGYERWLLYRLAIESGLRANELRSLTISSFDFKNQTVAVVSGYTKNKCECEQKIMKELCSDLKHYLSSKLPKTRPAFPGTLQGGRLTTHTAQMLKLDLEAAGIPYKDESKRYMDFHSLRHQCGSLLAAAGVHPKVAQEILRHSKIELTMSIYTHVLKPQKEKAIIDAFSDYLGKPSKSEKKKHA